MFGRRIGSVVRKELVRDRGPVTSGVQVIRRGNDRRVMSQSDVRRRRIDPQMRSGSRPMTRHAGEHQRRGHALNGQNERQVA